MSIGVTQKDVGAVVKMNLDCLCDNGCRAVVDWRDIQVEPIGAREEDVPLVVELRGGGPGVTVKQ